jgi:hypothetical protein
MIDWEWVTQQIECRGLQVSDKAKEFLVAQLGSNQDFITRELDKLVYISGPITGDIVRDLVPSISEDFSDLVIAAVRGNYSFINSKFEALIAQGLWMELYSFLVSFWSASYITITALESGKSIEQVEKETNIPMGSIKRTQSLFTGVQTSTIRKMPEILENTLCLARASVSPCTVFLYYFLRLRDYLFGEDA